MFSLRRANVVRGLVLTAVLIVGLAPAAVAADDPPGASTFHNIGTVTQPAIAAIAAGKTAGNPTGLFASFDISWVDNAHDVYYLADRSNNAVDQVDASDGSFVQFLGQGKFAGVVVGAPTNRSGPDGVVTDRDGNVWVGDGFSPVNGDTTSHLKGFNPDTGAMFADVDLGGTGRADELAFGAVGGGRILIANPDELTSAFVSLVDTSNQSIIGQQIKYDAMPNTTGVPPAHHGFNTNFGGTQHGLEQSVFSNNHFYLNVPGTVQNPGGEIDVFDANQPVITDVFPLTTCAGTGLAVGPQDDLIVECADSVRILDPKNHGHQEAIFAQFGGADEIWFNPGDGNAYFPLAANTTLRPGIATGLGILDVVNNRPVGGVPLNGKNSGITPVSGAQGVHSVAASSKSGRIFLPSSDNPDNGAGGIIMLHAASSRHKNDL